MDIGGEERNAVLRVEVDDLDVEGAEPVDAALESAGFADDDAGKTELANETAAIPAGRERGDHSEFAIGALATGIAEGVSFSVERRIAELHPAIVARAEERAVLIEDGGPDRNAAFGEAFASFGERNGEHTVVIERGLHRGIIRGYQWKKFRK